MSLKTFRNIIIAFTVLVMTFGLGVNVGRGDFLKSFPAFKPQFSNTNSESVNLDFSLFWDVWERLNKYYLDKKQLDKNKMFYGAISGLVSSLGDPYTVFLPPEQNKEAKDDLKGRLEGIGVQLGIKDKKIVVIAPLKGTPAEIGGVRSEDWIVKVDGKETVGWTIPEAVSKIRGPKGTPVVLTVLHKIATQTSEIKLIRDEIKVASVEWEIRNIKYQISNIKYEIVKDNCNECQKIIYLKLSRFGDDTTGEWNKAVEEIRKTIDQSKVRNLKGLIFDLRNNPGGYLSGSVFIASEFLRDGTVVIQESANGSKQLLSVNRKGKLTDIPMVILINKGSASASEIVAGALKEKNRAKLVGETTFGKGSIQEAQDLANGAGIHITTAKWLLPSGTWINGTGVEPDIKIENDPVKTEVDLQLEKGFEVLVK